MKVKKGDKIKVEYEGRLDSGEIFDSSTHGDHSHQLEFEVGAKQVIKGFNEAVIGLNKDDEKKFSIKAKDAYGEKRSDLERDIPRNILPKEQEPKEGMILALGTPDGKQIPARITKVDSEKVRIDLNHPLAGQNLNFKVKIVEIESKSKN